MVRKKKISAEDLGMLVLLDSEAARLGIPRQAVIKVILDGSLKKRA